LAAPKGFPLQSLARPGEGQDIKQALKAGCRGITAGAFVYAGRFASFGKHTASPCDFLARFFAVKLQKMRTNDYGFHFGTDSNIFIS
jgi:hypothetical protein